jgi:hypothetical protein
MTDLQTDPSTRHHGQTYQDDHYEAFETFTETTYIFLVLKARQQRLSLDEVWLLDRAARALDRPLRSAA